MGDEGCSPKLAPLMDHRGRRPQHSCCPRAVACKPCTRAAAPTPEAPFLSPQPRGKPLNTVRLKDLKHFVQTTGNTEKSLSAAAARRGPAAAAALPLTANRFLLPYWPASSCSRAAKQQALLSTATHPPVPHTLRVPLQQHGPRQTGTC